jgi:dihydrofolate reductase
VKDAVAEEIQRIKKQPGKDIALLGSGSVMSAFTPLGLIDEYRIMVNPVVLGRGRPLFAGIKDRLNLNLLNTRTFRNGNVLLSYGPGKEK